MGDGPQDDLASFASLDKAIQGHLTPSNLAVLAAEQSDHAEPAHLWSAVIAECPGDGEATARRRPGWGAVDRRIQRLLADSGKGIGKRGRSR